VPFQHRPDVFSTRRSPAPEQSGHFVSSDQPLTFGRESGRIGLCVGNDRVHAAPEQASSRVQVLDGQERSLHHGLFAKGHRATERVQNTDPNWLPRRAVGAAEEKHAAECNAAGGRSAARGYCIRSFRSSVHCSVEVAMSFPGSVESLILNSSRAIACMR
jgi:hypothetical protein